MLSFRSTTAVVLCSGVLFGAHMALAGSSTQAQTQRPPSTTAYLDRLHAEGKERVIVKFERSPNAALVEKHAGRVIREIKLLHAMIAEIPMTNMRSLENERGVLAVFPDVIISVGPEYAAPFDEPSAGRETAIGTQTHPTRAAGGTRAPSETTGAIPQWENLEAGSNSKAVWDRYGVDGTGIKVAFIDTGINYNLTDLGGGIGLGFKCLGGYDFVDDDNDPMPYIHPSDWTLSENHGTAIAASCLGSGESQIVGAAKNASYYSLRILSGPNAQGLLSDGMAAIEWCLDPDGNPATTSDSPDIINMSFAVYDQPGNPFWPSIRQDFENICNAAYDAGIILVAASGNDGYTYSAYPAAFANVVSVGGYAEDQTLFYRVIGGITYQSNGGVDIVAPGEYLSILVPEGATHHGSGTSTAAACTSGFIALQLQYARQNNIAVNNGYLWEVMRHSAKDMPLIPDPNYKGKGKIWAAESDPPPPTPQDGSIDCMAAKWPISFTLGFLDYAYTTGDGLPAYLMGTPMVQNLGLHNVTDTVGSSVEDIVNLTVTTRQAYCGREGGAGLPGASVEVFGGQAVTAGGELTLPDSYDVPWEVVPGTNQTSVEFQFQFAGNDRSLHVGYRNAEGLWVAARDPNIPAVSEWGMVAMAALMLAAGAVVVSRRRAVG